MLLVHGAAHGLGPQAYMRDLGIDLLLIIESDSSSAKAFASRRRLGKQRRAPKTRDEYLKKKGFVEVEASKSHKRC